jgi:hypothetical protein
MVQIYTTYQKTTLQLFPPSVAPPAMKKVETYNFRIKSGNVQNVY